MFICRYKLLLTIAFLTFNKVNEWMNDSSQNISANYIWQFDVLQVDLNN